MIPNKKTLQQVQDALNETQGLMNQTFESLQKLSDITALHSENVIRQDFVMKLSPMMKHFTAAVEAVKQTEEKIIEILKGIPEANEALLVMGNEFEKIRCNLGTEATIAQAYKLIERLQPKEIEAPKLKKV